MSDWLIGVDIGGTFTDLYARDGSGAAADLTLKVPTTPSDPAAGVMDALRAAAHQVDQPVGEFLGSVRYLGHASTISTNLIVERNGDSTGLLVTAGFPDSLALQRLNLGRLTFDLGFDRPTPLVDRSRIREIPERVDRLGDVLAAVDEDAVLAAAAELVAAGVEAIAIAYLWSFRNPVNELRTAELIRQAFPDVWLSMSHQVVPLSGEYERTSTTVIDAYIGSKVSSYLHAIEDDLRDAGLRQRVFVMQTVGGTAPIDHVAGRPVRTLNSGPVAGAAGAAIIGSEVQRSDLIAGDVGGTSFDVSVIVDNTPLRTQGASVLGLHTLISTVDVNAIGAGGGSIARAVGGRLQVGPESAGAVPGPACYGKGGLDPTVTDAIVVLGVIDTESGLAAGSFGLERAPAEAAIRERVAAPLEISIEDAALAIYEVVNAHMADAIRVSTVRRGHDPRDFSLVLFGGAGPAHGWAIAEELGIPEIIVPAAGSVLSAHGLVSSEILFEEVLSRQLTAPLDGAVIAELLRGLGAKARETAAAADVEIGDAHLRYSVDIRYVSQLRDLAIALEPQWLEDEESLAERVEAAFTESYDRVFGPGTHLPGAPIRLTRFRAELVPAGLDTAREAEPEVTAEAAPSGRRTVSLSSEQRGLSCPVYDWPRLAPGAFLKGPALIVSPLTTCVVGPGQRAWIDGYRNVRIELGGSDDS
jgi:N-methylhydantoinase A